MQARGSSASCSSQTCRSSPRPAASALPTGEGGGGAWFSHDLEGAAHSNEDGRGTWGTEGRIDGGSVEGGVHRP